MLNLPPYKEFPELQYDNIIMRQISTTDIANIIDICVYDGKWAVTAHDALEILNKIDKDYQDGNSIHWGIVDIGKNIIVGSCGYYRGFDNDTGEMGFILKSEFRRKGYMLTAVNLAANYGLMDMGLKKVIAITSNRNIKAKNLLTRAGFEIDRTLTDEDIQYKYC
ncbi:ribosomal-protein-alanine N-acetyltransferase [Mucilaginibacter mallensis]|uniref:Ribosomal-protein-alanine N-acetyltransferase n=1 Tax=Mucilaginibacter mallensis TaxID=652787 RepID=A0A1H1RPP1_MUCMA|nr:GNAT family N-acetyltransferase [Mucilaginibacter mallensis]SDS37680.1 ribosomal-protein-alanine N-acetyltransferase [Mucilaginibacter mallensis]